MPPQRLTYIDNLKGFAILLVILGHVMQFMYCTDDFDHNIVWRYIYSFHMPLFMTLSGMVTSVTPPCKDLLIKKLKSRFLQLIIPFCTWGVVWTLTSSDAPYYSIFISPDHSLWFLWVLFFIVLAYWVTLFISSKIKWLSPKLSVLLLYPVIILLTILGKGMFGTRMIEIQYPFFLIGVFLGTYKYKLQVMKSMNVISIFMVILFVCSAYFWYRFPSKVPAELPSWVMTINSSDFCHFVIALFGCLFFISFFAIISKQKWFDLLSKLGRITLPIYAIHQTVIWLITHNTSESLHNFFATQYGLVLDFVMVFATTIAIYKLLNSNKTTSLLMLGTRQ